MSIALIRSIDALHKEVRAWRDADLSVGVVPTMGALHGGHLRLVGAALEVCERVIVTVFVNPTQFGPNEDFSVYPRDEAGDRDLAGAAGAHMVFVPGVDDVYPGVHPGVHPGGGTSEVHVPMLDGVWEGASRPGHFTGVATVVAKLLLMCRAEHAFFGEKDFQQLQVIRAVVRDLFIPTMVHGVATVRAEDGLALSSRNAYLSPSERALAPRLNAVLVAVARGFRAGEDSVSLCRNGQRELVDVGFGPVDYLAIVDGETLQSLDRYQPGRAARVVVAARLGRTRLIDNVAVK